MSMEREPELEKERENDPGGRQLEHGDAAPAGQGVGEHTHQMRILVARQRSLRRRQFEELTGIPASEHSRILVWQVAHGLMPNGKIGKREVEVARLVKASAPPSQAESAASNESAPAEASAPTITKVPDTADDLVAEADTSHNRHGGEGSITYEEKDTLFETVCFALEKAGIQHAIVAGMAGKVLALARQGKWSEVRSTLAEQLTSADTILKVMKFIGEKIGRKFGKKLVDMAEGGEPAAIVLEVVAIHIKLANLIIDRPHRTGDHNAQLQQYAWAWANEFMRDDYLPAFFSPLDEQMQLMNACLRFGVEDARATRTLFTNHDEYLIARDHLAHHYGDRDQGIAAIVRALTKQAGVE